MRSSSYDTNKQMGLNHLDAAEHADVGYGYRYANPMHQPVQDIVYRAWDQNSYTKPSEDAYNRQYMVQNGMEHTQAQQQYGFDSGEEYGRDNLYPEIDYQFGKVDPRCCDYGTQTPQYNENGYIEPYQSICDPWDNNRFLDVKDVRPLPPR